jgi:AcrR family transcriptional regulator
MPPPDGSTADLQPGIGRPRDPSIDDALAEAAEAVLRERGIAGFSLGEVARRGGVPKSTVYRRWGTQRDLLLHALERFADRQPPVPDTGSLHGDLVQLVDQRFLEFRELPQATIERMHAQALGDATIAAVVGRIATERHEAGRAVFRRAAARGELRPDIDIETAVELVAGAVWTQLFGRRPLEHSTASALVDRILRGFGTHD